MIDTKSAGRPRSFAMEQVLDAAISVFRRSGFHGASLTDLGRAMRLAPGSIYKAFPDKRAIYRAALERYIKLRREQLCTAVGQEPDGWTKIRAFLEYYVSSATGAEGRAGCMVINAAAEAADDLEAGDRAAASLSNLESLLVGMIGDGKRDGTIRVDLDEVGTARMVLSLVQGFRVVGKLGREPAAFTPAVEQLLRLLRP